jgi:DNA-binding protein Fis
MSDPIAKPLREWIDNYHDGNITHAAKALHADKSTLYRVMDTAYVINGTLYTIKRKAS